MELGGIERQDAADEALLNFAQLDGEFLATELIGDSQFEDAIFDFTQTDDADEKTFLVLFVQQGDNMCAGAFLAHSKRRRCRAANS